MAGVPITALLHNGPLHGGSNMPIKGLIIVVCTRYTCKMAAGSSETMATALI